MDFPKRFKRQLEDYHAQKARIRKECASQEEEYSRRLAAHSKREESLIEEKIRLCRFIFAWKDQFLATTEGAGIYQRSGKYLWVFSAQWGHRLPQFDGSGCWARTFFVEDGLKYWAGYKWMPEGPAYLFKSPEEMARTLSHKYIDSLENHLSSGKVFDFFIETIK